MNKLLRSAFLLLALAVPVLAFAQASGTVQSQNPMNRDLKSLQTLTAAGAATTNSSDQNGFNTSRITCIYRQSAFTGTPSVTFSIQGKDATSSQYYTLLTSAAITTNSTNAIHVGAGVTTTANVSAGLPIPRTWRTTVTVGGTTPTVTATVGCSVQ